LIFASNKLLLCPVTRSPGPPGPEEATTLVKPRW